MNATQASVTVHRTWRYVELQFSQDVIQTRMLRWFPYWLHVDYTRTMLAGLWLHSSPKRIGIIGLGGGAQTKFCYRYLPQAHIEVVENNPEVLAQRSAFAIPEDDERLQVNYADGAQWLRQRRAQQQLHSHLNQKHHFDLLLLDAYDQNGIPSALSSQGFYNDCRAVLSANGVLASNLYSTPVHLHISRLARSFAGQVLVLSEPQRSNHVVIAWNGCPQPDHIEQTLRQLPWLARCQLRSGFKRLAVAWDERKAVQRSKK